MATFLKQEAIIHLKGNKELQTKISPYINGMVHTAIARESQTLTTWLSVEAIAESMEVSPSEILEVRPND